MNYTISDTIKTLCAKPNLSDPDEQETVKQEIIKYLKDYLDLKKGKNSLADVTGIVRDVFECKGTVYPFERDIAGRMMRTRNYTMKEVVNEGCGKEVYVIASDRPWWERYNPLQTFGGVILGASLTFIGTKINNQEKKQTLLPTINIEDTRIPLLHDSLKILEAKIKVLKDSLTKIKHK